MNTKQAELIRRLANLIEKGDVCLTYIDPKHPMTYSPMYFLAEPDKIMSIGDPQTFTFDIGFSFRPCNEKASQMLHDLCYGA